MKITPSPDKSIVNTVRESFRRTGGFCSCRREKKVEYKCICDEFKAQIEDSFFELEVMLIHDFQFLRFCDNFQAFLR